MTAYLDAMRRYARFQGRMSRGDYWRFVLVFAGLAILAVVLDQIFSTANRDGGLFIGLLYLSHILPGLAAGVRRLHDVDRSGWWTLVSPVAIVFACLPGTAGSIRSRPEISPATTDRPVAPTSAIVGPAPNVGAPRDRIGELERLAQLRASGSLSETEFEVLKRRRSAEPDRRERQRCPRERSPAWYNRSEQRPPGRPAIDRGTPR